MIHFTSDLSGLQSEIKKNCKPDDEGFYRTLLGGFNTYNSRGHYYAYTKIIINLFAASADFMRMLKNGALIAEVGHPERLSSDSDTDFGRKWLSLDHKNACGIFKEISQSEKPIKVKGQKNLIYPTWGLVKPYGVHGEVLKHSLEDPYSNTAFSIRSLSNIVEKGGKSFNNIFHIIGYDFVPEPGISFANKVSTNVNSESFDMPVTEEMVKNMRSFYEANKASVNGEANENLKAALDAMDNCSGGSCLYETWK